MPPEDIELEFAVTNIAEVETSFYELARKYIPLVNPDAVITR